MKLDFETNLSHVSPANEEFYNDTSLEDSLTENSLENNPTKTSAQFQTGVRAAREGNRAEARFLLLRVVEAEPDNEAAWMQLASVSEYPEELLGFLNHALRINPDNEKAAEWKKSTGNLLAQKFVQRGGEALENARKNFARQCFLQAIAHDDENETAWLQMAKISDSVEEKNARLEKVLSLNPKNEAALALLKPAESQTVERLLQRAVAAAIAGTRETTKPLLDEILSKEPKMVDAWILKSFLVESFEEKIECFEKILDVDDENELANVNWTALLDIMAKADSKNRTGNDEEIFKPEESSFKKSNSAYAPAEMYESVRYNSLTADEDAATIPPDFNVQSSEKEIYFNEPSEPELQFGAEDEENFVVPETTSGQTDAAEDATPNRANYSLPQSDSSREATEEFTESANGEPAMPRESVPSYYESYESEELAAAPLEMPEKDRSNEYKEDETDVFELDSLQTEAPVTEEIEEVFAETVSGEEDLSEEVSHNSPGETVVCPFCGADEDALAVVCHSCRAMLTLSDLEMLLAHPDADRETLREAIDQLEAERNLRDFDVEDLKLLALGEINLKNLRQGCAYLSEAAQMNPNDVFLGSRVNFLKIRLAEIEEQQSLHDSMPKNRKILVVDDSATVRKLISGKLEKSGHEVFNAVDGIDALEQIKEFVPDLILLDINMPRMDGYQVCKLIRANEATRDVPIVMISGKDGFFDKVRGRMAGTTGYITKPFGPETLMKMLDTYIV